MRIWNHAVFEWQIQLSELYIYVCVDILVYKDHNDNNDIIGKILNDDYITTSTIVIMMKISIMWIRMNRMIR